ncbi:ran-binding protein M isoform X1 [Arctopsyche grandis]|uniref:ran-binding protein M isoform X1 n=1 Tax=Arctopsyche grandis TaxID=121162 RepID=UPI00406D7FAD
MYRHGKTHKDAASVRATHPIPPACGLYYFEVRIVSKGRDGYMGIGLSAQGVNMNRLPGWDKHSYGYHGDDGHSFCSSGTGQPYGPTFTTGDVIGCGVNLIDNTCFYTKNGHHLGVAFRDLPPNLYPTVGLQTPGEVVDANFGQQPFVFDIEDMIRELRARTRLTINEFPIPDVQGEWQAIMQKMVSSYLVHHGYCGTAEAFARATGQVFDEEISSIKNRQRILKLVLAGRMGEAIESARRLYPNLLEQNQNLLFMLKCRQFVEMVNGSDSEMCVSRIGGVSDIGSGGQTSVILHTNSNASPTHNHSTKEELNNQTNIAMNGTNCDSEIIKISHSPTTVVEDNSSDVEMESSSNSTNGLSSSASNGTNGSVSSNGYQSHRISTTLPHVQKGMPGITATLDSTADPTILQDDDDMEVDLIGASMVTGSSTSAATTTTRQVCGGSRASVERMLEFGKELYNMSQHLPQENAVTLSANKKMLEDAFSLLAYSNPWASPVGWQLDPSRREPVCSALNSAILESQKLPWRAPLEACAGHAAGLLALMAARGLGACAFADLQDLLRH